MNFRFWFFQNIHQYTILSRAFLWFISQTTSPGVTSGIVLTSAHIFMDGTEMFQEYNSLRNSTISTILFLLSVTSPFLSLKEITCLPKMGCHGTFFKRVIFLMVSSIIFVFLCPYTYLCLLLTASLFCLLISISFSFYLHFMKLSVTF